ncbi:hypothetical protein ACTAZI_16485 [Legionella bozemanae]|uniref:hypothetical protein n=1 Tax=Legionella bozemanae TaxID=447 RepID=UPI003EEB556E
MQSEEISNEEKPVLSDEELHVQANQYISEFNQLIFQNPPSVISQIIEREVWKKRNNPMMYLYYDSHVNDLYTALLALHLLIFRNQ